VNALDADRFARALAPRDDASWEGWFAIAIGAPGSAVRWTKTHVFRDDRSASGSPISALEGLDAEGEIVTFAAIESRVVTMHVPLERAAIAASAAALVEVTGARARVRREGVVELDVELHDRMDWVRIPKMLRYVGACGLASGTITIDGARHALHGAGVVEHAFGAHVPFDPLRFVRGPWHWDVLSIDEGVTVAAALWITAPGLGMRGVRATGRLPGGAASVRAHAIERASEARWRARLRDGDVELEYEAVASTERANVVPGGGFVGFDFEGTLRGRGARRVVRGRGFAEMGGEGGHWRLRLGLEPHRAGRGLRLNGLAPSR
jgi:hypothetical protein